PQGRAKRRHARAQPGSAAHFDALARQAAGARADRLPQSLGRSSNATCTHPQMAATREGILALKTLTAFLIGCERRAKASPQLEGRPALEGSLPDVVRRTRVALVRGQSVIVQEGV